MRITKMFSFISIVAAVILIAAPSFAANDFMITSRELAGIIGKPGVVIVDARGEKSYKKRHLSGAVNFPAGLIVELRDEAAIKKSDVAIPVEKAEKLFGEFGISNDSTIVVYDSPPSVDAAYVWFTLKMYGAENVRILTGGIKAWRKEKRPLTKAVASITPAVFNADLRSEILTDADWIMKNRENIQLVDTRSFEEFIGARSVGHIPGAFLLEWKDLANAKKTFKSAGEMNEIISNRGISKDKQIVIYCAIGIRASFVYTAFDMLGYKPKFYWGSMLDWQDDPNRPIGKK
ncbi:MAG TPA: sulfurtransferase [Nitrospirae bacterium]|nr:sulfurtransferase [Nitrospirota bacterium]